MTHTVWGLYEQIMREQIMRDEDLLQLRAEEIHQPWHHCTHMWALASRAALLVEENSSQFMTTVVQQVLVWCSSHLTFTTIQRLSICKSQ